MEQAAELRELVSSRDVPADIATRGRIVLWSAEGRRRKDIAELLGVSLPTVDRWKRRYAEHGVAGLEGDRPGGAREQVPARVRARVIALSRMTPPDGTGLSHWSTRELAKYLKRTEDVIVSWHYIARIWREENLKPHRSGTFKISKDPAFAQKVADVIGLYLDPPGGTVVLSIDEKTQVQALDRTQPVLPWHSRPPRSAPTTMCGMARRTCSPPSTSAPGKSSVSASRTGTARPSWLS
ncbi:IS630 family transposase [Streptomyces sp. NBC_01320]|uniref:IS630 family transposase n=1 Tax=Streptomyces sp. NBC_01320 TaxID=2903824 RepID=UPI002E10D954|nr:IS630 family transposase [Streptomyces sp. NBC_01320]